MFRYSNREHRHGFHSSQPGRGGHHSRFYSPPPGRGGHHTGFHSPPPGRGGHPSGFHSPTSGRGGRFSPLRRGGYPARGGRCSTPSRYSDNGSVKSGGHGSHRSSRWASAANHEHDEYRVIRNSMQRLFPKSEVAKWTQAQYLKHKQEMLEDKKKYAEFVLKQKEYEKKLDLSLTQPFEGKTFDENNGNRGAVLGEQTIWCVNWRDGKEEVAPWPSAAEMKWEGDDRAKTFCRRYLPIPRERGTPYINWQHLIKLEPYPFDEVRKVPTLEDTHLPVDEIMHEDFLGLINRALLEEIDHFNLYLYLWDRYNPERPPMISFLNHTKPSAPSKINGPHYTKPEEAPRISGLHHKKPEEVSYITGLHHSKPEETSQLSLPVCSKPSQ